MPDPQNPAESKPPIAPGSDAQAPASSARPAPSSKNEPKTDSSLNETMKAADKLGKKLERLAEKAEANSKKYEEQIKELGAQKKALNDSIKEQEKSIKSGKLTAEEQKKTEKQLVKSREKKEELDKKEAKLTEGLSKKNEELGDTVKHLLKTMKGFGDAVEGNEEAVKKLTEMKKDLTKVTKADFKNAIELVKLNEKEITRRKGVDAARGKLDASGGVGGVDPKALAVFKGVNSGLEKLIDVASLNGEQQKNQIAEMMKDEKEREKVTIAVSEGIRAEMEANQKTLKDLQKKAESKDGFGGVGARLEAFRQMEALKKSIAQSGATLEEIQKGGVEGTAAVEKLLDSQLAMSDEQRKQHIQSMEKAAEMDAKGIPPELVGLLDNVNAMKGLLKDIGIGQKGGFLKLIFVFLAFTLGAWISAIFQRFLTLVSVIKGIPMAVAKIGGLIGKLGSFLSKFGSVGAKIGGLLQKVSTFVMGIGTKLTSLFAKIGGLGAKVGAGFGKLSGIMTKLQKAFKVVSGIMKIFGGGGGGFLSILTKAFKFGFNFLAKIPFIGWIITGIMAIIDIFKVFSALKGGTDSFFTKLMKGIVVALINFLTLGFLDFKKVLNFVNKLFSDFPGTIKALFSGLFDKVVGFIKGAFSFYIKYLGVVFLGIPKLIWGGIWSLVKWLFGKIVGGLASIPFIGKFFGGSGGQEGPSLIGGIMGKVKDAFGSVKEKLNEVFFSKIKAMMDMVLSVVKTVINGIKSIINAYVNAVTTIINAVVGVIKSVIDGIRKIIEAYYKGVVKVINLVVDVITLPLKIVKNALMEFADVVKQITGQVKSAIIGLFNKLADSAIGKFLGLKPIQEGAASPATPSAQEGAASPATPSAALAPSTSPSSSGDTGDKLSLKDYATMKADEGVSAGSANELYVLLKNLLDTGEASNLDDVALNTAITDAARALTKTQSPDLKGKLKSVKVSLMDILVARKQSRVGKGAVSNQVSGAASEYAQAKSAKDAAQAQSASKPVVANNTTVMNKSSNTTQVTSAPSRYNAEPTLRGMQMGALPGMV